MRNCQCGAIEFDPDVVTNFTVKLPDGSVHGQSLSGMADDFHCTPSKVTMHKRMADAIEQGNALMAAAAAREKVNEERHAKETADYNARVNAAEERNKQMDEDRARYTKATERIADALDYFKSTHEQESKVS